jgi:hypothetical protein
MMDDDDSFLAFASLLATSRWSAKMNIDIIGRADI